MSGTTPYYADDYVTLHHGDCRELLPSIEADVVVTDPPYGVAMQYGDAYDDGTGYADLLRWLIREVMAHDAALITPGIANLWKWPEPRWVIGWFKPGAISRGMGSAFNEWEPVLVYGNVKHTSDVVRATVGAEKGTGDHPCPKPLALFTTLVGMTQGTVLDPFAGSGTTLVAAKSLNRKAIGIEIEERYCEVAASRLRQEVLGLSA